MVRHQDITNEQDFELSPSKRHSTTDFMKNRIQKNLDNELPLTSENSIFDQLKHTN